MDLRIFISVRCGKDDTNDNSFVSGEGRSYRTGYSKDRSNAYGRSKKIGWKFNEDGSYDVTYSDGTQDIAPINEVSSKDDAFFDGKNTKYSLGEDGKAQSETKYSVSEKGNTEYCLTKCFAC